MAESMIGSLFGLSPEMYGEQQRVGALNEGITLANMNPAARGAALTYAGAKGLGTAIGGAMGVQDPQLQLISARKSILGQIDQTDPNSLIKGAQTLAQMGDQQGAFALADYARKAQSEIAQAKARLAQATRERQQAVPNDIQIANEIATLEDTLGQLENVEASPERTRAKNMLNTRLTELRRITTKGEKAQTFGVEREAVAKELYNKPFADLTQTEIAAVNKRVDAEKPRTTIKNEIPLGDVLQKVFQSKEKEDSAKAYGQAGEAYKITIPLIKKLETVENTVNNAFTGAGSNAKLALSKGLSALGVKISDRATDTEIADAVSAQVVQQIAKVFPGSQSNKELEQLLKSKFNIQQELPTILRLVGQIKDEMLAQSKTYEQMAKLPADERSNFNANLAQGQNYQKIQKYREYEKKYLAKTITAEERAEAAKLKQELSF